VQSLVAWPPLSDVAAVMKARYETRWNLLGCPKLMNRSQPLVGRSSLWGHFGEIFLFNIFFRLSICLSCKDTARQSCAMVRKWRFFASFLRPVCPASHVQYISDLHPKFTLRPHHVWSMVDIQSPTAEIRQGKEKKKEATGRKYNGLLYSIGWP